MQRGDSNMYFKNISNAIIDVDGSGNFDVLKDLSNEYVSIK